MKKFAESKTCRRQVLLDALGGEQAACDGCDVCERGRPADFPEDADFVLNFIRSHRKLYSREELIDEAEARINRRDVIRFGMCIWESGDISEILDSLEKEKLIRRCLWPWYGKIDCGYKRHGKLSKVAEVYSSPWWKKLERLELVLHGLPGRYKNKIAGLMKKDKTG